MEAKLYIIGIVVQCLATAGIGLIAWMGRKVLDGYETRIKSLETDRISRDEFRRMQDEVDQAVSKEEWLRSHTSVTQRLDKITSKLDEMDGGQRVTVEIAAAIAAALNAKREN